jgi:predicted TIM-barrel fold metal-dependent hydrolase
LVILHNDIDMPFAKSGSPPVYLEQITALFKRHPRTTIVWAHMGLGRVVHPVMKEDGVGAAERRPRQLPVIEEMVSDPELRHVYFDISWDEVAKYLVATPQSIHRAADVINRYPDRFLFGTDTVAPSIAQAYFGIYDLYKPLWLALIPEASEKVRQANYERLFDEARGRVRVWEKAHIKNTTQ